MKRLLERIGKIDRTERGKLCRLTGRPHFNHQTRRNGRNEVRCVPAGESAALRQAIEGYQLFMNLVEPYAAEVIRLTRRGQEAKRRAKKPPP